MSFSASFFSLAMSPKKLTRKEQFLADMERIIPWDDFGAIIAPHWSPNTDVGRRRTSLIILLRMYFLQQWYNLSDVSTEEEVYAQIPFQKFLDINCSIDPVPDATTLENFRHVIEEHGLAERMHALTNEILAEKHIFIKQGTAVDATIINAPSSTKNKEKKRDPEMHQTKKGNQWYHGMKAHVGTDTRSGIAHTIVTTAANVYDGDKFDECLHGKERAVFGDKAYPKKERIQALRKK